MDIRGHVFSQTQIKASPTLKVQPVVDLRQADVLTDNQGVLAQGAKNILVKVDDKKVIQLKFNVGADGITRQDFLAAVRTAIANADGSLEQVALKKALGDVYTTVMGAQHVDIANPDELVQKVQSLDARFSQLKQKQTQNVTGSLTTTVTRDHRATHLKHAPIVHKGSAKQADGIPFAEQRQYKLGKLFPAMKEHHLLKSYGLLVAKSQLPIESQGGLRQANLSSTQYLRDFHKEADTVFSAALTAAKAKGKIPDVQAPNDQRLLINSPMALAKITDLLGGLKGQVFDGDPVIREIAPGLCALDYKLKAGPVDPAFMEKTQPGEVLGKVLDTIGATPSTYIAQKYLTDADKIFSEVLKVAKDRGAIPDIHPSHNQRQLFTSTMTMAKLEEVLGAAKANVFEGEPVIREIPPDLCALDYKLKAEPLAEAFMEQTEPTKVLAEVFKTIGATPSIDAALPANDDTVDNKAAMDNLLTRHTMTDLGELAEKDTGVGAMAAAAIHLVQGLEGAITDEHKQNPLLANSLQQIGNLMEVMAVSAEHPEQFAKAINFLMEELEVVLAITKPYGAADYTDSIKAVQAERLPALAGMGHGVTQQAIGYASSGMDALSTAFAAARKLSATSVEQFVDDPQHNLNYFEVPELLHGGQLSADNQPIMTAALNPSTPSAAVNLDALADKVKKNITDHHHNPTTLILDITIEKNKEELNTLLGKFKDELEAGTLNIILCKSYQKYGSLGTGKLMAGNVTVINNGDIKFKACTDFVTESSTKLGNLSESGGKLQQEESQLMTHVLKHAHGDEIRLIKDAAKKAKFIDDFCFPATGGDPPHVAGLPFVLRPGTSQKLKDLQIDLRDSFSFMNTSYLDFNGRINPGHESESRMVEQFYALGYCKTQTPEIALLSKLKLEDGLNKINFLCIPNHQQHLDALANVPLDILKTNTPEQILGHETLIALGPPNQELRDFVVAYAKFRGNPPLTRNPQETFTKVLTDLKGKSQLPPDVILANIRKYQPSISASFLHFFTATNNPPLGPTKTYVTNTYTALINNNFSGAMGSEAVTPTTRATIMREWAALALVPPTDAAIDLLAAHTDDMPAHARLSVLDTVVPNAYFDTVAVTEPQKKLLNSAIKDAPIREVLGLVDTLIAKGEKAKANALLSIVETQALDVNSHFNIHKGLLEPDVRAPQDHDKDLSAKLQALRQRITLLP